MIDRKQDHVINRLNRAAELLHAAADIMWMATRDEAKEYWPAKTDWCSVVMDMRHQVEAQARMMRDMAHEIPARLGEEYLEKLMSKPLTTPTELEG